MGQEKNAENIPFLRSTQPKSTERVPVVELSGFYPFLLVIYQGLISVAKILRSYH